MSTRESPRSHLLLPWAVQEREDPVLEFDHAEGMYFFDRQGRRYLVVMLINHPRASSEGEPVLNAMLEWVYEGATSRAGAKARPPSGGPQRP